MKLSLSKEVIKMANKKELATVGKPKVGGAVWRAPVGTTLPTSADGELDNAFNNVGYISEDGVEHDSSIEAEEIKSWEQDTVLRPRTSRTDDFKFAMLEMLNPEALKVYYGDDNVTGDLAGGITVNVNANDAEPMSYVIDMITSAGGLHRIVIPNGVVSETESITYKPSDAAMLGVTVSAMADEAGNSHYEYFKGAA